jgi:hypothetical protein
MSKTGQPDQFTEARTRDGSFRLYRVVEFYDVETNGRFPFASFTLRIIALHNGELQATPNVQVYNSATECIEHVCGLGATVEDAVISAIEMVMSEAEKQRMNKSGRDLDESDFVWLNWQPYVQLTMPPTL